MIFLILQLLQLSALANEETNQVSESSKEARVGNLIEAPVKMETRSKLQNNAVKTEKRRDRRTPLEKETEGTEALDRFEAETVLKSKYQVDGQALEVDPD